MEPDKHLLIKTAQGVNATRNGQGLSSKAHVLLKAFDGSRTIEELKELCKAAGLAPGDFDGALQELMQFEFITVLDLAAAAEARRKTERRLLKTLDFTMPDFEPPAAATVPATTAPATLAATAAAAAAVALKGGTAPPVPPPSSAGGAPKPPALPPAPRPSASAVAMSAASPASPVSPAAGRPSMAQPPTQAATAAAVAEARLRVEKAERMKRDAEIHKKLVAVLTPRVEEELRTKLRPKLEEELRPKLIAALKPGLEAEVRSSLTRELTPRIELELKAHLAQSLAAQKTVDEAPVARPAAAAGDAATAGMFERLLASLDVPAFALDRAGCCLYANPALGELCGRAAADLIGAPLAALFVHRDRRAIERLFLSIAEGSALRFDRQAQLALDTGAGPWMEVRAAPLYNGEGKPVGVCGHIRDASELKRLTDQSEADGVRLLLLVDQIDTGVMLEDRDGNIQQVNPALCSVLALDAASYSLEGMPVAEFFDSVSRNMMNGEVFQRHIADMRAAGLDITGDNLMMADGRVVHLDYLAITSGEETVGRLWLAREMARATARAG